ncbi:hypothetical protein [Clostridioides difficile]|nr:hypothetical protein [Clostridioides difficile]
MEKRINGVGSRKVSVVEKRRKEGKRWKSREEKIKKKREKK